MLPNHNILVYVTTDAIMKAIVHQEHGVLSAPMALAQSKEGQPPRHALDLDRAQWSEQDLKESGLNDVLYLPDTIWYEANGVKVVNTTDIQGVKMPGKRYSHKGTMQFFWGKAPDKYHREDGPALIQLVNYAVTVATTKKGFTHFLATADEVIWSWYENGLPFRLGGPYEYSREKMKSLRSYDHNSGNMEAAMVDLELDQLSFKWILPSSKKQMLSSDLIPICQNLGITINPHHTLKIFPSAAAEMNFYAEIEAHLNSKD